MTRWEFLIKLVKENNYKSVVEVGVADGKMSTHVIRECDLECYVMVDKKVSEALYEMVQVSDVVDGMGITEKPVVLMRMIAADASRLFADSSVDLVFIDADHEYDAVVSDIQCWMPKVRIGGIICGHDWDPTGGYLEVVQVVEEAFPYYEVASDSSGGRNNHVWWVRVTEEVADFVDRWAHGEQSEKRFDIRRLRGISLECIADLDASLISKDLRTSFGSEGIVLSEEAAAVVDVESCQWLVVDGNTKYYVTEEGDELGIYNIEAIEKATEAYTAADGATSKIVEFFEPYPFLRGFSKSWEWMKDVNHSNPFFSPLYYLICRNIEARHILEIGCEHGYSSYMLAMAAKENGGVYYCIEKSSTFAAQLKAGLTEEGFPHVLIWADSKDVVEFPWADQLDFVLLDGEHSVEAVLREIEMIYPKLRPSGYVVLHDVYARGSRAFYSLVRDSAYDFEYVTFPNNFGLALLRKRESDWSATMQRLAASDDNEEPSVGWMYHGEAPADGRVVIVSSTIPEIAVQALEEVSMEEPQKPEKVSELEQVGLAIAEAQEPVEFEVPDNLKGFVAKLMQPGDSPAPQLEGQGVVVRVAPVAIAKAQEPVEFEVPDNLKGFVAKLMQSDRHLDL